MDLCFPKKGHTVKARRPQSKANILKSAFTVTFETSSSVLCAIDQKQNKITPSVQEQEWKHDPSILSDITNAKTLCILFAVYKDSQQKNAFFI